MTLAFDRISMWLWGGKEHEPTISDASSSSSMGSSFNSGFGFREPDAITFPSAKRAGLHSTRRNKRKWQSKEERRVDKEFDLVMVPPDGVCLSESDSDDSDWSIGWMEPHAPDFQSENENENSFAVIVQCYAGGRDYDRSDTTAANNFDVLGHFITSYACSTESKKYMEDIFSSIKNS